MTANDITLDNIERISCGNPEDLYEFNYSTEKYFRTGVESKPAEFRLKATSESILVDYSDKRAYDKNLNELGNEVVERLEELGLVHPGSAATNEELAELIAATDYKTNGCVENVVFEDDDIDSEDGE